MRTFSVSDDQGRLLHNDLDVGVCPSEFARSLSEVVAGRQRPRIVPFPRNTLGGDATGADSGATPFDGIWHGYCLRRTTVAELVHCGCNPADPYNSRDLYARTTCPTGTRPLDFNDLTVDRTAALCCIHGRMRLWLLASPRASSPQDLTHAWITIKPLRRRSFANPRASGS